jgi:hypothetical protein
LNDMTGAKKAAAQALYPMLELFQNVNDRVLQAVQKVYVTGSLESLILTFDGVSIVVRADPGDDTVELMIENNVEIAHGARTDVSRSWPWSSFIGRTFGWGWLIVNQQGYCDGVLFSFDGIAPQVMLNVVASSIKENIITRANRPKPKSTL